MNAIVKNLDEEDSPQKQPTPENDTPGTMFDECE